MRHRKLKARLNRTTEHRTAMFRNMAISLIERERIHTTEAKAKHLRTVIEPLITMARDGSLHKRRQAFAILQHKEAVHRLFEELGPRFKERNGGYTRVVKDHFRAGDGAPTAYIELVDAEFKPKEKKELTRREQIRRAMKKYKK